ncbi:MAG: sigma-70 family RNA polymerase sigma factor [Lentimicrobiaceae bacterium]|nr:sigma-70 family RNA polymerase sigma factor [Lentimicrobiaceae bacterium]
MPFDLIIAQCQTLHPQAQMAFYSMFYEQVFQRSYALLKNAEHAEEIMQDTLLKMLQNISSFKGDETSMQKLLNKIAINQSIDVIRKRRNIIFIETESFPEVEEQQQDIENDEKLIETALQHLNTLPDGYRMVIVLRIFEEMPFDEIGKKLNITASTARSQYIRGLQKLKTEMKGII